jgi:hypothetical protein
MNTFSVIATYSYVIDEVYLHNYWFSDVSDVSVATKNNLYFFACVHSSWKEIPLVPMAQMPNSTPKYLKNFYAPFPQLVPHQSIRAYADNFQEFAFENSENSIAFSKIPCWIKAELENGVQMFILKENAQNFIIPSSIDPNYILISGVLRLSSKTIYGKNNKGMTKFKFIPRNKEYPHYIVASRLSSGNIDKYVKVEIKVWQTNESAPFANLAHVHGDVDDTNAYKNFILDSYNIIPKTRNKLFHAHKNPISPLEIPLDFIENCLDITHLPTLSIDPVGCVDIDDALSYNLCPVTIFVNIATPTLLFQANSDVDKNARSQFATTYDPKYDLLPLQIIERSSLKLNETRYCLSVKFELNENGSLHSEIIKTKIKTNLNLTYESADSSSSNTILEELMFAHDKLFGRAYEKFLSADDHDHNFHKFVEFYMLQANKCVADFLVLSCANTNIILRKTSSLSNKAWYLSYNEDKNNEHSKIGSKYAHFTSPIRRYADQIVHRQLIAILNNKNYADFPKIPNTFHLNRTAFLHSVVSTEIYFVDLIFLKNNKILTPFKKIRGLFKNIYLDSNSIPVITFIYLDSEKSEKSENKRVLSIPIYSYKLSEIFIFRFIDNGFSIQINSQVFDFKIKVSEIVELDLFWDSKKGLDGNIFKWHKPNITDFIKNHTMNKNEAFF